MNSVHQPSIIQKSERQKQDDSFFHFNLLSSSSTAETFDLRSSHLECALTLVGFLSAWNGDIPVRLTMRYPFCQVSRLLARRRIHVYRRVPCLSLHEVMMGPNDLAEADEPLKLRTVKRRFAPRVTYLSPSSLVRTWSNISGICQVVNIFNKPFYDTRM